MASVVTRTVSAIFSSESVLEVVINKLTETTVARHDISIQGPPEKMEQTFGKPYVRPDAIQKSANPPKKEHFLRDDFGWVVGFSFGIPVFICVVVAVFLIGDVRSPSDNIFYGVLGGIVGAIVGAFLAKFIKKHQIEQVRKQERAGGFVIWVTVSTDEQINEVVNILNACHAREIKVS
ncbi:hypothetical protein [Legionella jordanis]|uniref:Transmembrane protein n=1 Tax=Legionella jordanis TaxID=456 RepID=A0A0W0VBP6_9GAMM|nr:hypothetical protein [Legionella jordanis]KTD17523.1 hypothetical protein Ljor_1829 [Legionella jordanis]RMX05139.1 hypothetical protein EAW55_00285 [Legionella jordanis]RMX17395.1 hypothetical protein EAS68_10915 [Legionella jordanis]VEH13492.1 Uncharacterised protein [Legionella jordanis]HAT8714409.1 hypothetical protein [Legionella jordanis]